MRKIVAIGGLPGTGKTTLMRNFMKGHEWKADKPAKLLDGHFCEKKNLFVFGKYDNGEVFAGTDKLSMAVQPIAVEYVKAWPTTNVLYEGDRLFTASFLEEVSELPDTEFHIIILTASNEILQGRYAHRGSDQSEQFIKSRKTKINNISSSFLLSEYITYMPNNNVDDLADIVAHLDKIFQ